MTRRGKAKPDMSFDEKPAPMRGPHCRHGRPWTAEQKAAVVSLYGAYTVAELAGRFGKTVESIRGILRRSGVRVPPVAHDETTDAKVIEFCLAGKTLKEAGKPFGLTQQTVRRILAKAGFATPKRSRYTEAIDLDALRRLNADGWPDAQIAQHLGVGPDRLRERRIALGLPSNKRSWRALARNRYQTAVLCAERGLAHFGELPTFSKEEEIREAAKSGWPGGVTKVQVKILDAIQEWGAMSRVEVANRIGFADYGSPSMAAAYHIGLLIRKGLVIDLGPAGCGIKHHIYTLALTAERRADVQA